VWAKLEDGGDGGQDCGTDDGGESETAYFESISTWRICFGISVANSRGASGSETYRLRSFCERALSAMDEPFSGLDLWQSRR